MNDGDGHDHKVVNKDDLNDFCQKNFFKLSTTPILTLFSKPSLLSSQNHSGIFKIL